MSKKTTTHSLDGKKVLQIDLAKDYTAVRFIVEGGNPIFALADGDCCSESWIEHVSIPAGGFPATVVGVSDIELPGSDDTHPEYDCLRVYGLKISTDRGDIVIDYRNSSNGFYGGHLVWPGGVFWKGASDDDYVTLYSDV